MADTPSHPKVDPERTTPQNAFDNATGYSGQEFDRTRQAEQASAETRPAHVATPSDGREIPPEAGHRAAISANGEVHGSGANAGGGQGENFDDDAPGEGAGVPPADRAPDR